MSDLIKEISMKEIEGISIGHAQDDEAKTGVSVIYFKNGAQAGCDISGGGPASRETLLTDPMTADNPLNVGAGTGAVSESFIVSDVNLVGTLSAKVMQKAILKADEASKISDEEYLSHCL